LRWAAERLINPNDAPAASLARLPGIGIIKANAIVEYRLRFQNAPRNFDTKFPGQKSRKSFGFHEEGSGSLAFQNCSDLDNVKGIGPITIEKMCEWLRFK
jgi:DNA uptake protein ComE-like DNA-binding protein